jgi:RNA polymerase sigma-70 factor (ECF subfamily)
MSTPREQAFEQARAKWSGVALDYGTWCEHLDGLGWAGKAPATSASLFLCCACARGDAAARQWLEQAFLVALRGVVARENADTEFVEWVMQSARQQLFGGEKPRIATYDGGRPLADWLRVVVRRIALGQKLADRAVAGTAPVPPADVRRIRQA